MALTVSKEERQGNVAISIDVEWAHPEVLADAVRMLDERGILATFFCTHDGIDVGGHERALHPNFRRSGNTMVEADAATMDDRAFYAFIVSATRTFCPEAVGVRSHSLLTDSNLLPIYRDAGLEYDSSYMLPLAPGLAPAWRGSGILEIPIYYMDHWDLSERATGFGLSGLRLEQPGLKVLTFHPNLIFLNAASERDATGSKAHYNDPDWLLAHRHTGRGVRSLFIEVLDDVARAKSTCPVLSDINVEWRAANDRSVARESTANRIAGG